MDHLDFSEKEIRQQLAVLGYRNIPKHKLLEFKKGWYPGESNIPAEFDDIWADQVPSV